MGWIPLYFAHRALALVGPRVAAPFERLRAREATEQMRDTDFFDLLEHIDRESPDGRAVPMRVGASMRCDDYGAFGLAFKSALELGGSYRRVERYGRVVTSASNFRLVEGGETSLLSVIPGLPDRPGLRLTNELALSAALALSREVGRRPFDPIAVHLTLAAPRDPAPFREHFACPLHFDAEEDALEVTNDQLRAPNRLGDASISRFFDLHLDRALDDLPVPDSLVPRIRAEISTALSEGVPTLDTISRRLAMSGRTLQRRLAEEDIRYQDIVSEARRGLAKRLLRASDCSLAEVAFLTGFADQSSFGRAFKRWFGRTPRAYRRAPGP